MRFNGKMYEMENRKHTKKTYLKSYVIKCRISFRHRCDRLQQMWWNQSIPVILISIHLSGAWISHISSLFLSLSLSLGLNLPTQMYAIYLVFIVFPLMTHNLPCFLSPLFRYDVIAHMSGLIPIRINCCMIHSIIQVSLMQCKWFEPVKFHCIEFDWKYIPSTPQNYLPSILCRTKPFHSYLLDKTNFGVQLWHSFFW